jgi:two-component system, response regulator PdtaR
MSGRTDGPVRVLMADDDPLVLDAFKDLLPPDRYLIVGEAANGRQAVEMVELLRPDVVLLDVRMPGMGGVEAAREIRDRCPVPVVMVTALEDPALADPSAGHGAGAYVVKPPSAGELQRAIALSRERFAASRGG